MTFELFDHVTIPKENATGIIIDFCKDREGNLGYIIEGDDEDCTLYWCEASDLKKL